MRLSFVMALTFIVLIGFYLLNPDAAMAGIICILAGGIHDRLHIHRHQLEEATGALQEAEWATPQGSCGRRDAGVDRSAEYGKATAEEREQNKPQINLPSELSFRFFVPILGSPWRHGDLHGHIA
jgi:hypothetical protein